MPDKSVLTRARTPTKKILSAELDAKLESKDRRRFLSRTLAAGTAVAGAATGAAAIAETLPVPPTNKALGKPIPRLSMLQ